jgi:hypothetical protein
MLNASMHRGDNLKEVRVDCLPLSSDADAFGTEINMLAFGIGFSANFGPPLIKSKFITIIYY